MKTIHIWLVASLAMLTLTILVVFNIDKIGHEYNAPTPVPQETIHTTRCRSILTYQESAAVDDLQTKADEVNTELNNYIAPRAPLGVSTYVDENTKRLSMQWLKLTDQIDEIKSHAPCVK